MSGLSRWRPPRPEDRLLLCQAELAHERADCEELEKEKEALVKYLKQIKATKIEAQRDLEASAIDNDRLENQVDELQQQVDACHQELALKNRKLKKEASDWKEANQILKSIDADIDKSRANFGLLMQQMQNSG